MEQESEMLWLYSDSSPYITGNIKLERMLLLQILDSDAL